MKTSGPVDGAVEVRTIKLLANRRMQEQIGGDVPALKEREVALIIALIFDPCGTDPLGVENQKTDRRRKKKVDICSAAKPNRIDYLKHSLFTHTPCDAFLLFSGVYVCVTISSYATHKLPNERGKGMRAVASTQLDIEARQNELERGWSEDLSSYWLLEPVVWTCALQFRWMLVIPL